VLVLGCVLAMAMDETPASPLTVTEQARERCERPPISIAAVINLSASPTVRPPDADTDAA